MFYRVVRSVHPEALGNVADLTFGRVLPVYTNLESSIGEVAVLRAIAVFTGMHALYVSEKYALPMCLMQVCHRRPLRSS